MDVRVLFEGTLDKCTVEHGKKDWKRRYFVFKHILASNIRSLEFYAAGTKNWRKAEPKGVLALYPGYEVVKVHEPRRHFVFEIKTVDHTYRVAAHSEDELNQWILVLERESIVNSFCVEPEANEHMAKLGASDTCHLHVANNELRLLCAKDGRLLVAWPFTCLRRYMSAPGKFTVEAGRRAPTGEGKFAFLTPQHDEIYNLLDNVIKSRAGNKPSTTSLHAPLRKTKSVPADGGKDVPHNDYEQLMATSQGTCTEHQMSSGSSNSMKNAYAAPYGHLPSRDAMKTASPIMGKRVTQTVPDNRLSVESEEGEQYNTLNHPLQDSEERQHSQKGIKEDEYSRYLDQNLSPPHMYAILHHHGNSKPIATSQHQAMEDAYNVLGETLPHVVPSRDQSNEENTYNTLDTKPTSQSQISMSAPQDDQMYNTLNQANPARSPRKPIQPPARTGQPVVKPPPKPLARNLSSDLVNKPRTSHSSSPNESEDMYNTLDTSTRPPPPPIRKMPDQGDDDTYNTLETSKPRHPPPSPVRKTSNQLKKLQKSKSFSVDTNNDVYNTLDTAKVGRHSPVPIEKMKKTFQASTDKGDEMYNVLDAAKRAGKSSMPAPRLTEQSLQSVDGDEMYNTLDSARVGAMSSPICNGRVNSALSSNLSRNDKMDDMYNTLDESRTGGSVSAPVPPQRSFLSHGSNAGSNAGSPVKKDSPALQRNSASSLQSLHCPLDAPVTQPEIQKSSSLDDLDSYASIDYATMSPPKGQHTPKQVPVPAQRPLKTKGLPPRGRKSSAPDIISFATTNSGKDVKKGGKSGFVSNLKASLEAGGLDFTKPRRKPKKLSREDSSGELPTHAEIEEDVFAPSTPPTKAGRSSSSPADPRQGEDIYDELDQSAPRPKSLQITKPKKVA